jgi:ppGpp synthetase/RelA/SpoT-type nucleotidyltranferase
MTRQETETKYLERMASLETLRASLEKMTSDAVGALPHIYRVSFRVKGLRSFMAKVFDRTKDYADPFSEVEDQVAGRVLVFFRSDIDSVQTTLLEIFNPVEEVRKAPTVDSEFGYESHHMVLMIPPVVSGTNIDQPTCFELQIRTLFMHAWAEPQHDLAYKGSELPRELRREFAWAAASAWGADQSFERILRAQASNEER